MIFLWDCVFIVVGDDNEIWCSDLKDFLIGFV